MKNFITLLLLMTGLMVSAQHPNHKVWAFGLNAGLDFHTQPPTPITTSSHGWESYASQCDEQGNLLFYSNGEKIYDKQHGIMPHGDSLKGNIWGSTSQGVQIIPHPAFNSRFIVFSLDPAESYDQYPHTHGSLYYTVVDMNLNGGLGDIVTGQKNILIDSLFSEHMMVAGNDCKMWLITHMAFGTGFRCYEITEQGISTTPVVSQSGFYSKYIRGEIVFDPAGSRIFLSSPDSTYINGIFEMHDFDMMTGIVSNPQLLPFSGIYYRLCVSPEASKLYATGSFNSDAVLDQYDITLNGAQAIVNSKIEIHNNGYDGMADMAVGPDSMIYGAYNSYSATLFRIEAPEMSGTACNFSPNAVSVAANTQSYNGLPSPSVRRFTGSIQNSYFEHDTAFCGPAVTLSAPDTSYDNFIWSTGTTGVSLIITQPGTYWLTATSNCKTRVDTFNVTDMVFEPNVIDTGICFDTTATLSSSANLPNYLWSDGSTTKEITVTQSGIYWVRATDFCMEVIDTFKVSFVDFTLQLPGDTALCDDLVLAPYLNNDYVRFLWQDGSTGKYFTAKESGKYWVQVTKLGCTKADTMYIDNRKIQIDLGSDTTLCENNSLSMNIPQQQGTSYTWQDGKSGNSYIIDKPGSYSVYAVNSSCEATDSVKVSYEKCNCVFNVPSVFSPNGDGKNEGFTAIIEPGCPLAEFKMSVYNRFGEQVFTTNIPTQKWDGRYKGQMADVGTYMYMLRFKGPKDKVFFQKGDVSLVR
jgi:gliding motility-associated-like protein